MRIGSAIVSAISHARGQRIVIHVPIASNTITKTTARTAPTASSVTPTAEWAWWRTRATSELGVRDVKRRSAFTLGDGHHLVAWRIQKLGLRIDEALDQPRTGDAIHLWSSAGYPFHEREPPWT